MYINRQQAINSKSINNISSGEDIDLAIFISRRCKGQGSEEALRCPDGMKSRKEMGELSMSSSIWTGELAMDINMAEYSRERRLYADYLTDSRLLAQFRSSILFLNTQETISHLQAECTTKESLYSPNRKGKKRVIYSLWAYFAQIRSTKRAKATKKIMIIMSKENTRRLR